MRISKRPAVPVAPAKAEATAAKPVKTKQHTHAPGGDSYDHGRPKPSTQSRGEAMTPVRNLRG